METLRTIWSDIKRDLKQGKDDLEIPDKQGWYWCLVVGDRLRMQHIEKRESGAFLTTFVLPVIQDTVFANRRYVELPESIYDYDMDGGVQNMSYYVASSQRPEFTKVDIFRSDPGRLKIWNKSFYQSSTPENPYFWREGPRLYIDPPPNLDLVPFIEAKLLCNLPDISKVNPDAVFQFPKELIYPLKRAILDMGRFALALPGEHLKNDGTNRPENQTAGAPEKTVSVADPVVNTGSQG